MTCSWVASPSDPAPCQRPVWSQSKTIGCRRVESAGGTTGPRWPGSGRALHSGPLPRPEVPVPWMEQSMQRHEAAQRVGRGAEENPASKTDALGSPSSGMSQLVDDGRCPFEASHLFQTGPTSYSQPSKYIGHFMPLAPKPFPWDRNGERECLLCSRFFFVPESFSSCTESLPLF